MNATWAAGALATVVLAPGKATSTLLMTSLNHIIFAAAMLLINKISVADVLRL